MNERRRSREMVHVDENDRRHSAGFFEYMRGVDDTELRKRTRATARRRYGFTEEELDESYGRESRMDRAEAKRMGYTEHELDELFGPETE